MFTPPSVSSAPCARACAACPKSPYASSRGAAPPPPGIPQWPRVPIRARRDPQTAAAFAPAACAAPRAPPTAAQPQPAGNPRPCTRHRRAAHIARRSPGRSTRRRAHSACTGPAAARSLPSPWMPACMHPGLERLVCAPASSGVEAGHQSLEEAFDLDAVIRRLRIRQADTSKERVAYFPQLLRVQWLVVVDGGDIVIEVLRKGLPIGGRCLHFRPPFFAGGFAAAFFASCVCFQRFFTASAMRFF